ncbi:16S rRNA (uracil(1498)-N(3))-methyltransferase [Spongorhabdus nitratireducens]
MNLLLLQSDDFVSSDVARVTGARLKHVTDVHRAVPGDTLRVGALGGMMGEAVIEKLDADCLELSVSLDQPPPPKLPLTVLLALPRPKMLKRTLQTLSALGVESIVLMNSYRVEKSFWQSPWLAEDKIREQLVLGLEQARDTVLPEIIFEKRFKPFVEDRLPELMEGKRGLVAHPVASQACPIAMNEPSVLAIGPEGGFIPYEVEKLEEAGFERVHMGTRILRVEVAIPTIIGRLYT